jgi:signal transduction histidine kinase/Tfp pilus assembly protein PilF
MRSRVLLVPLLLAATPALAQDDPRFAAVERSMAATKAAMMGDPRAALALARRSVALAEALPSGQRSDLARASAQWLEGEALIRINATDRAKPLIEAALATARREAPGSKLAGDLMRSRGAIAAMGGRVQEALADFQAAYRIFVRAGETRSQAIALQDIGAIYLDAGDYQHVLEYYARSAEVFSADPYILLTTHNNRAQVYREMKRYGEAVAEYRKALADARKIGSPQLEVGILTNLAATLVDAGRLPEASAAIARAGTLPAAGEAPFILGVRAKIAAARGDRAGAAQLLDRVFAGADLRATPMPFKEFHKLAADVFEGQGQGERALAHLRAFHRLDNEGRALIASTSAQLVSARFDFTSQNLRIAQLKQGQLTRDIQMERQRSRFRTTLFASLLGAAGLVLALVVAAFLSIRRSRNQVRAANTDLTETNERLADALAAKSEFLAMTSHEIRTPLNGILGMTQVLLARPGVDPQTKTQVAVVQTAGEAMKAIVDDILDVAKMEREAIELHPEPVRLDTLLGDVAGLWRGQAEAKGLAFGLDHAAAPPRIVADGPRLRQVLTNLVSNAVKFTRSGSVSIRAEAVGDRLRLHVADTGIGIAPDHHASIFEAFRQVDAATTREFGGTGLGLAICCRLVTAMDGSISVESDLGHGATFTIDVPLTLAEAEEQIEPADQLLLFEPNLLRQSMFRTLLASKVAVVVAATEEEARTALAGGGCSRLLFDADSGCAGDPERAAALVALAARGGVASILLHPAGAEWSGGAFAAARLLAKPVDGATILANLNQSGELRRAA